MATKKTKLTKKARREEKDYVDRRVEEMRTEALISIDESMERLRASLNYAPRKTMVLACQQLRNEIILQLEMEQGQ